LIDRILTQKNNYKHHNINFFNSDLYAIILENQLIIKNHN